MKKEDTIISYRPDVAKAIRKGMENMLNLYSKDQRGVFYKVVALHMENSGDAQTAALLNEASELVLSGDFWDTETFCYKYEDKLNHVMIAGYALGEMTQVEAFIELVPLYKDIAEDIRKGISTEGFSRSEQFSFNRLMSIIKSPLRNPNVQYNGYYMNGHAHEFPKYMKSQVEFIRNEIESTLSLWETPDEEEEIDR